MHAERWAGQGQDRVTVGASQKSDEYFYSEHAEPKIGTTRASMMLADAVF